MRKERKYYVYLVTNKANTTLYIGVTNNIENRVYQHKSGRGGFFTSKYKLKKLVYYEEYQYVLDAISREKQIKGWVRRKKNDLINKQNPSWSDLAYEWYEEEQAQ